MKPTEEHLRTRSDVKAIRDLLLAHGGDEVDLPDEWLGHEDCLWQVWMAPLVDRGCINGPRIEQDFIAKQQCHKNSATLFLQGRVDAFGTGFGLHADKLWYFHSWGIRNNDGEVIIETVGEAFKKYFGAVYTGEEGKERAEGLLATVTMNGC